MVQKKSKILRNLGIATLFLGTISFTAARAIDNYIQTLEPIVNELSDFVSTINSPQEPLFEIENEKTSLYNIPIENNLRSQEFNLIQRPDTITGFNTNLYELLNFDEDFLESISSVFNTVMIDIKETDGIVPIIFNDNTFYNNSQGFISESRVLEQLELLEEHGFYRIARISVFKDNNYSDLENSILNLDESMFESNDGISWLDIYNENNWEYITNISEQVIYSLPFEEINFDYIRAPAINPTNLIFPSKNDESINSDAILDFVDYSAMRLIKYGVNLSFDLFGASIIHAETNYYKEVLGQDFVEMARRGYIYGMFYPTHYSNSPEFSNDWLGRVAQIKSWSYEDGNRILTDNNIPTNRLGGFIEDIYRNNSDLQNLRLEQLALSFNIVSQDLNSDCIIWSANNNYLSEVFVPFLESNSSSYLENYISLISNSNRAWNQNRY